MILRGFNDYFKLGVLATLGIILFTSVQKLMTSKEPVVIVPEKGVEVVRKMSSPKNSYQLPDQFHGVSQDDANLIEYIRRDVIKPPSTLEYNLTNPDTIHFSQYGQAKHAESLLRGMKNGFFLEVGALDGELHSNTLYFERELGWRGLLIEAFPESYNKLRLKHRKAFTVHAALALTTTASDITFQTEGSRGVLKIQQGGKGLLVKALPFYSILAALGVEVVDFFSLDIESFEVKVLKTFNFDKIKFRLMCVEVNHIPEGLPYLIDFMRGNGYVYLGKIHIDAWFGWPDLLDKDIVDEALRKNPI